jgi:hypothetical protein
VHLIRHSLRFVGRREREQVARDLKPIYTALDADAAVAALEVFEEQWGQRFPVIPQAWRAAWEQVIPFLAFPGEVRRVIYTTNAIEALNRQLRKAIKTKGISPTKTPHGSSSISPSTTPCRPGQEHATGPQRSSHSKSTSETAYPTNPAHTENRTPSPGCVSVGFAGQPPM